MHGFSRFYRGHVGVGVFPDQLPLGCDVSTEVALRMSVRRIRILRLINSLHWAIHVIDGGKGVCQ